MIEDEDEGYCQKLWSFVAFILDDLHVYIYTQTFYSAIYICVCMYTIEDKEMSCSRGQKVEGCQNQGGARLLGSFTWLCSSLSQSINTHSTSCEVV